MCLPGAHTLTVDDAGIRLREYWSPDATRELRYTRDEEYADHFLSLFEDVLKCRVPARGPVGIFMSGGLDSGSVAVFFSDLARCGRLPGERLEAFTLAFPGFSCDERARAEQVARAAGLPLTTVDYRPSGAAYYTDLVRRTLEVPDPPNSAMQELLFAVARSHGVRVVLTGCGPDAWFDGSYYQYADLLRRGRVLAFVQQARCVARLRKTKFLLPSWMVVRFGLWPLLPATVRRLARRPPRREKVPPWVDPLFGKKLRLVERICPPVIEPLGGSFTRRDMYDRFLDGWEAYFLLADERAAAWHGLEFRHPLHDQRVVQFALAIPEKQRWRGAETKLVLRGAMGDLLPPRPDGQIEKVDYAPSFVEEFRALGGAAIFSDLAIERLDWVAGDELRRRYRRMMEWYQAGDHRYIHEIWPLWMAWSIDCWLRSVFPELAAASDSTLRGFGPKEARS